MTTKTRGQRVCSVEGCSKPHIATGYCGMHWKRFRRTGEVGPAAPQIRTRGVCSIEGCGKPHEARGWCAMHWARWKHHGDVEFVSPALRGPASPRWRGDDIAYVSAHSRVVSQRGDANSHPCKHCGETAQEWAYDHADKGELTDSKTGSPYSPNPDHYMPLCGSCHKRFDHQHRKAASA